MRKILKFIFMGFFNNMGNNRNSFGCSECSIKEVTLKEIATPKMTKNSTPKSSKKSKEKSKSTYVPGLDSELIVSGKFSKMMYKASAPTAEEKAPIGPNVPVSKGSPHPHP